MSKPPIHRQADEPPRPLSEQLRQVLVSAARLQELVPDAVLVGGAAAALHAGHRDSFDHDHVLPDLESRYAEVLDAVEASEGWATSVRKSAPPLTILGSLDGIEAGLRQLRRKRPLEVREVWVDDERAVRVPSLDEMLRVKSYLVVQRNQVRDYLDVVALADRMGHPRAAAILVAIDDYYVDRSQEDDSVLTALVQRLAQPSPRDARVTRQLHRYKNLDPRWHSWAAVTEATAGLADCVLQLLETEAPS